MAKAEIGCSPSLLNLPTSALEAIACALSGNAKKPLRATCRELRAAANETTDFLRIDVSKKQAASGFEPIPPTMLESLQIIQVDIPWHYNDVSLPTSQELAALNIQGVRKTCNLHVAVSVDSTCEEQTRLASVHFALLVDGLRTAGIWDRVRELHCSCERWLGPEISFGPKVRVRAHLRLSERNVRLNKKLLRATLSQPNLTELTIADMLPQDLDADLVRMLAERGSSLRRLTLRACVLTEHDPDVPLIFDLRPLARWPLERLEHLAVDSAYEGLVAVDGLAELLSPERLPRLRSLVLSGLSLVPFSTLACPNHLRYLPHGCADRPRTFTTLRFPAVPSAFPTFGGLTTLELSASHLGNLANLPALPGLERLVLRALARRSIKAYPAQLAGHEIAQLPRLRELVLDCVECPHGLQSDSLEHLEVVNSCLQNLFDLIGPSCPPRLASILVRQRTHGRGHLVDTDMARMYFGLMMISQLEGSCLPKGVPSDGRRGLQPSGQDMSSMASRGLLVSTKGGAWQFRDPQAEFSGTQVQLAYVCSLECAADFSFSLLRQS
ncbi:g10902 [Coccomyxa elongata]